MLALLVFDLFVGMVEVYKTSYLEYLVNYEGLMKVIIEILSLYLLVYSLMPGNAYVFKSDIDFLFMLPVDEKEVIISFSLASFIFDLNILLTFLMILAPIIKFGSLVVIISYALIVSFLGNILYKLKFFQRLLVAVSLSLWFFSAYFGFPYSPFSMLDGDFISYLILVAFTALVVYLSIEKVSLYDLVQGNFLHLSRPIKSSISFCSSSPFLVMLKKNLNIIELGGRGGAGGEKYVIARVRIYYLLLGTIILALIAYIFRVVFTPLFLEYLILVDYAEASFLNEPIWLNLSVMSFIEFARRYLISKLITLYILFLPVTLSFFLFDLNAGLGNLIFPLSFIYLSSVLARVYPRASQVNIRRFLFSVISIGSALAVVYLSVKFPIYVLVIVLALSLPFLFSKNFWEKTFEKAISSI